MKTIKSISQCQVLIAREKKKNKRIGFVPTMGALHQGHLSLIRKAQKENDFVLVSIFVNPLQFGPREDYKKYPRNTKGDKEKLKREKVDLLFLPKHKPMYPKDFSISIQEKRLSTVLCGKSRPNHFAGVVTVLTKLFNITTPDNAYFGQKDYQQAKIVQQLVKDLNFPLKVRILPIVREPDGLAMSSRNTYLNKKQREQAVIIYRSLQTAKKMVKQGIVNSNRIKTYISRQISGQETLTIDYVDIVDTETLQSIPSVKDKALAITAVFAGKTRLIDNMFLLKKKKQR